MYQWALSPDAGYTATYSVGQRVICDTENTAAVAGVSSPYPNPQPCDAVILADAGLASADCYNITHVGNVQETWPLAPKATQLPDGGSNITMSLWGTPMTVVVSSPKTPTAKVAKVLMGTPVAGPSFGNNINSLFTPTISGDGHLLVVGSPKGLLYAYSTTPCDVTGWTDFKPITGMYEDGTVNTTYGLARFPIRDTENNLIQPTYLNPDAGKTLTNLVSSNIPGGYLWMDSNATMLFTNASQGNFAYYFDPDANQVVARFPVVQFESVATNGALSNQLSLHDGGTLTLATGSDLMACNQQVDAGGCFRSLMAETASGIRLDQAMAFFGLWTNGKVELPDGHLNKNAWASTGRSPTACSCTPTEDSGPFKAPTCARRTRFRTRSTTCPISVLRTPWTWCGWLPPSTTSRRWPSTTSCIWTPSSIRNDASMTNFCCRAAGTLCTGLIHDGYVPQDIDFDGAPAEMHIQNAATSSLPSSAPSLGACTRGTRVGPSPPMASSRAADPHRARLLGSHAWLWAVPQWPKLRLLRCRWRCQSPRERRRCVVL